MGHQIMRQPDGKLAVFSTNTDTILLADATPDELLDYYAEQAAAEARRSTQRVIDLVQAGRDREAYGQFTRTYEERVEQHRKSGGEERMVYGGPEW